MIYFNERRHAYTILVALVLLISVFAVNGHEEAACNDQLQGECENKNTNNYNNGIRLISRDELQQKTGEDDPEIWLSILGDVYDVTGGESFYGKGTSYGAFAGRDCSVCFVSGIFSPEEAKKNILDVEDTKLLGILNWVEFYSTHESYNFVGHFVDPRYYKEDGNPTKNLVDLKKKVMSLSSVKK